MNELQRRLFEALTHMAGHVPRSVQLAHPLPRVASREMAQSVAKKAAAVSACSAVLPGIGATAFVVADLIAVLKIQQKMIADLAAIYGETPSLTSEVMVGLLFKDTSPNATRSLLASKAGWVKPGGAEMARASNPFLRRALQKIAWGLARRILGKSIARIVPVIGAAGAGIGSYRNTLSVAETAMAYFESRGPSGAPASATAALSAG